MMKLARIIGGVILLAGLGSQVLGQTPVIASFSGNGELVCTNLEPGTAASVEWAPSVLGPWTNNWAGLGAVTADSNGTIRVSVPMSYRVRGVGWTNPAVPPFASPSNMVWLPAGQFLMGDPAAGVPQTQVTLTRGFFMGRHEVTQGEYLSVIGSNPSSFTGDPNRPVERVTWYDATNYCAKLTARELEAGKLPAGWAYSLPTEAEWEYACRAGSTNDFSYGNDPGYTQLANYAWHNVNSGSTTHSVRGKLPNAWGLYDMYGNVVEWCLDWWGPYPTGSVANPRGPASGSYRVIRGGSWIHGAGSCTSAHRGNRPPSDRYNYCGCRVVLAPEQP